MKTNGCSECMSCQFMSCGFWKEKYSNSRIKGKKVRCKKSIAQKIDVCVCTLTHTYSGPYFCSHDSQYAGRIIKIKSSLKSITVTDRIILCHSVCVCVCACTQVMSYTLWPLLHNRIKTNTYLRVCMCVSRAMTIGESLLNDKHWVLLPCLCSLFLCLYLPLHLSLQPSGPSVYPPTPCPLAPSTNTYKYTNTHVENFTCIHGVLWIHCV